MASGGPNPFPMEDMFQSLESPDTNQNIKQVILENLSSTKDPWLINLLVEYYFRTQSTNVQDILGQVRNSHSKALMERLVEGVKSVDTRLPALQLLLFLVYKELPWCHQLVESPLFSAVLKCLKSDTDVPMLMTSVMILVILLPSAPVLMSQYLNQIFEIFGRLSLLCMRKPANTPDVFFLHLQVALYSLFHRLYGMYPSTFLDFISKFFGQKENIHAYEEIILPMLERVRLHPGLVMGNVESEMDMYRWKNQETQDIIVSCSKLSLDLVEGSWEDSHCPIFHAVNDVPKFRYAIRKGQSEKSIENESASKPIPALVDDASPNLLSACVDLGVVGESPSVLIGLATPPSSHRNTPAASFLDANTSGITPDTSSRQATPCYVDDGERSDKTPLSRSSSRSVIQQPTKALDSGKKSGLITPKALVNVTPNTTPITPGTMAAAPFVSPNTPPTLTTATPFKSRSSAFGIPIAPRSPATRTLNFSISGEHEESTSNEDDIKEREDIPPVSMEEKQPEEKEPTGSEDTSDKSVTDTKVNQDEADDLEVEEIISEQEDKFDAGGSPTSSVSTLASQADLTAESVRQFMKKVNRIRFNSLTSSSSSDQDACPKKGGSRKRSRARSCPPLKRLGMPHRGKAQASDFQEQVASNKSPQSRKPVQVNLWMEGEESSDRKTEEISEESSEDTYFSHGDKYKPLLNDPVYQMFRCSTKNATTQVAPPFPLPVSPAFNFIFAPAKLAICTCCSQELVVKNTQTTSQVVDDKSSTTATTVKGTEVSLFNAWPAPELLDQYLKMGSELHAKELTHIPLTSKENVNWTHFGGVPPADEVNILRGQILLLHTQLLYERHKRSNHAKRNRRLLRKIAHVATLEEQQRTLTNQIKIQEQEIQQLSVSVKLLQEDNRQLRQTQESEDYHKLVHYKTALKENKDLKASSIQLKNLLVSQREDYEKLQKKLEHIQHRNQDNEKELQICKGRLSNAEMLKRQVFHLEKEVLLMQELQQKCQEKLHHSLPSNQVRVELTTMINALQAQLSDVLKENKKKSRLLTTFQALASDMENVVKKKEDAIAKMKADEGLMRSSHAEQIKVQEEHHMALLHINQKLESNVMQLQCQLDQQQHRQMMEKLKANKAKRKPGQRSNLSLHHKQLDDGSGSDAPADLGGGSPSLVVASGSVSTEASAFDNRGEDMASSSSVRQRAETEVIDSGVGSRSSYRLDSDVSMQSISENSIVTNDSGCWQK